MIEKLKFAGKEWVPVDRLVKNNLFTLLHADIDPQITKKLHKGLDISQSATGDYIVKVLLNVTVQQPITKIITKQEIMDAGVDLLSPHAVFTYMLKRIMEVMPPYGPKVPENYGDLTALPPVGVFLVFHDDIAPKGEHLVLTHYGNGVLSGEFKEVV